MTAPRYVITYRTGYAKMDEPRPGFIRSREYDDVGNLLSETTNHYVCLGDTHCFYCGKEMK